MTAKCNTHKFARTSVLVDSKTWERNLIMRRQALRLKKNHLVNCLCIGCCVFWPANTCLHMHSHGPKRWKTLENYHKTNFFIVRTRDSGKAHARTWRKCSFLAFRSDSQTLVDTQKLVAPRKFHVNLVIFVREPLVSMIKNTDF